MNTLDFSSPSPNTQANQLSNMPEMSVSEVSAALKRTVENAFDRVRVRGEISGLKRAASGHMYLSLKDADAVMDGVIWRGKAAQISFRPEDGLEVIATGKLTTYPGRSKYQIVIETLEPAGIGALMALLEQRKKALGAEGLFATERKRALPFMPRTIGVVTSPTGAVIRDILHRLSDRCPSHVVVWPVLVQGDGAAAQIAGAIEGFNALTPSDSLPKPDVLIVARGGGSLEDLWAFNEENVVRAAANSAIPLVSAVGHETDTTLIDYASDKRAPTPTAAAEFCVPVLSDILYTIQDFDRRLTGSSARLFADKRTKLEGLSRGLRGPAEVLALKSQRFDDIADRLHRTPQTALDRSQAHLDRAAAGLRPRTLTADLTARNQTLQQMASTLESALLETLTEAHHSLAIQGRVLESVGYTSVLRRGYAVIRTESGQPITKAADLEQGASYTAEFSDGRRLIALQDDSETLKPSKKPRSPLSQKPTDPSKQGNLF